MAFEIPGQMVPLDAGSTAVTQFFGVSFDATGVILPGSTADANVIGIAQNGNDSTTAGQSINVMINGISKVYAAGSTMAAGDGFAFAADGHAIPLAGNATQKGVILEGSSGSTGRILTALIGQIA